MTSSSNRMALEIPPLIRSNRLYYGDNLTIMKDIPSSSIDLIYLDPPFNSQRNYNLIYRKLTGQSVPEQVVTSVEATPFESADTSQLPALVNTTAKIFNINEVSADKAYSDRRNLHAVQAQGGIAYIPFKVNSTGMGDKHHKFDGLWNRMIQSIYELGLEPTFWTFGTKEPVVPKVLENIGF